MTSEERAVIQAAVDDQVRAVCELVRERRLNVEAASHAILALFPSPAQIQAVADAFKPIASETRDYDDCHPEVRARTFPGMGVVVSIFDIYRVRDALAKLLATDEATP